MKQRSCGDKGVPNLGARGSFARRTEEGRRGRLRLGLAWG